MNYKNCATDIKRLIGLKYNQVEATALMKELPYECIALPDGDVGVVLTYAGEKTTFRCEQLVAMMFSKLQSIAAAANNGVGNSDVVVSVPGFFTDVQRRAMMNAAKIAGFNCLRLMNEHAALALAFGIYKSARNLFHETDAQHVMFIDLGHSSYTVSIVAFVQGKLQVKSVSYDTTLGGKCFDLVLAQHVSAEFQEKRKVDAMSMPKSRLKLLSACEKAKKNLSPHGVSSTNLNIECLVEEYDYIGKVTLEKFEELIEPLLARLEEPIVKALADAGIEKSQLTSVEIIGGGTRVSSVKRKWSQLLELDASKNNFGLSTTLNADESVARGCALQSAILSPMFQVKEFQIADLVSYPICVSWEPSTVIADKPTEAVSADAMDTTEDSDEPDSNSLVILNCKDDFPKTRRVTLRRSETFEVSADYDESAVGLAADADRHLGKFSISGIPTLQEGEEVPRIRVNLRQDIHGIFGVSSSQMMQEIKEEPTAVPADTKSTEKVADVKEGEAKMEEEKKEDSKKDSESKSADAPAAPAKKRFRKIELKVESTRLSGLSAKAIVDLNEKELSMGQSDRIIEETANKRNELESYIYDMRNQISDRLKEFISTEDRSAFDTKLQESEDWLYTDAGFDSTKSVYTAQLKELSEMGKPLEFRLQESTERPAAQAELLALVEEYKTLANTTEKKYDHWTDDDKEVLRTAATDAESWLYDELPKQSELSATQDPILTSFAIRSKMQNARSAALPILNKPAPKVEIPVEPVTEAAEGDKKETEMDLD